MELGEQHRAWKGTQGACHLGTRPKNETRDVELREPGWPKSDLVRKSGAGAFRVDQYGGARSRVLSPARTHEGASVHQHAD